jgi:hypothetical protein
MKDGNLEILAIGDRFSAAYRSIETAISELGKITYKEEKTFQNATDAVDFVRNSSFDAAVMPNPYGNERRLWIFRHLRSHGFPVIVFDRGALPGSWFFDVGFNADSPTYHPINWDGSLDSEQTEKVRTYIERVKDERPLEMQGPATDGDELRDRLGVTGKKVLFVAFQRPSDTTIKYFSGQIGSYQKFCDLVSEVNVIAKKLAPDWVVLAKKHPLEREHPQTNVQFVDDEENINSLIAASDMVLVVNSGVGLLASLWDKPVLCAGEAFYSHVSLNRQVKTALDVLYYMKNSFVPDGRVRDSFIYYLRESVYSFGEFHTELVKQKDGSYRNITRHIDFHTVRFPSFAKKKEY